MLVILSPAISISDEGYVDYEPDRNDILWSDFNDQFPPEGWILKSFHPFDTWKQVVSAASNQIQPLGPYSDKFVYVSGKSDELHNEFLISEKIIIESKYEDCNTNIYITSDIAVTDEYGVDFNLILEVSYDFDDAENPSWINIVTYNVNNFFSNCDEDSYFSNPGDIWCRIELDNEFEKKPFRIGFRYTGKAGTGVGFDKFSIRCTDTSYSSDDEDDEDSTPHEKSMKEKDDDCNCGLSFNDPAVPLALIMILIGCGALLISQRRHN